MTDRPARRLERVLHGALTELVQATAVLLAIAAATAALLAAGGYSVGAGLTALWTGSVGSWYALTSATLVRTVPLLGTGVGVAIAFRGGVFNIGAEGQLLVGAAAATGVALVGPGAGWPHAATLVGALVAAALGGALWAGIAALLRARLGVLEVISTIMLNFVGLHLVSFLVRGPLQEPTHVYPQSATIAESLQLPRFPGAGRLHVGLVLMLLLVVIAGWAMRRTAAGFRLIALGENPDAAASAGQIDTERTFTHALLLSGALAGLAGGVEVLGVTFALYENLSPGYGFTAIAVALLAGLDPWRVLPTAVLFGALEAGAGAMQRDAAIPSTLVTVIEAALILAVVSVQAIRRRRPRTDTRRVSSSTGRSWTR